MERWFHDFNTLVCTNVILMMKILGFACLDPNQQIHLENHFLCFLFFIFDDIDSAVM